MGLRIRKYLGYGLDNVITDKNGNICDPRFNQSVVNGKIEEIDWKEFLKYLQTTEKSPYRSLCYYYLRQKEALNLHFHWSFGDTFIYEEFGIPSVFLVQPIEMVKEWRHNDDSIDYYEAVSRSDNTGCAPRILKLDRPLYPFEGYMDARTGEIVQNGASIISTYKYLIDKNSDKKVVDEYCKTHFECINEEEFKENFVPCVPEGVRAQCRFSNIFIDEKTILELRPMIYEFWS